MPEFLTKLRTFIQNLAAQNIGKSNGEAATVNMTVREVQKACAFKNCVNPLKRSSHKYCPKHYQARKKTDEPNLPPAALEKMKDKAATQRKKKICQAEEEEADRSRSQYGYS